jgi:pyruvate/2-oxoglutarate dehydrogenase complex dihydrolipoamide acyltransferase (E2) component
MRAHAERWDLPRVGVGDVLAAVVARVLPRHPDLNAHWAEGVRRHESVHLGIAVDAPWGLVVPVVRDAQRLPAGELATSVADLASRARARTVGREEITGSTFTITNLGPTGVEHFTPLLNPPEVAILGVGALVPDGAAVRLPLSLTFDHRAVDGAPAGRFLADVAAGLEAADVVLALGDAGPREDGHQEGRPRP